MKINLPEVTRQVEADAELVILSIVLCSAFYKTLPIL